MRITEARPTTEPDLPPLLVERAFVERVRAEWEAMRRTVSAAQDVAQRMNGRAQIEKLERDYRRKLAELRAQEEDCYSQKDRSVATLCKKAKVSDRRSLIASSYFWLS